MKTQNLLCILLAAMLLTGCGTPASPATEPTLAPTQTTAQTVPTTAPTESTIPETTAATEPEETEPPTEPTEPEATLPDPHPIADELTATHAFVYDCQTEQYVFIKGDPEDWVYPASTTKTYCAWLALQYLQPDQILTVGEEINFLEWEASTAGLSQGDRMTTANVVKCLLMPSGCDAAYVLAASAGREIAGDPDLSARDAVTVFVDEMNRMAKELGFPNTHFITPDGYHRVKHHISLAAFVEIGKLCVSNQTILDATMHFEGYAEFADGRTMKLKNLNEILNPDTIYYREACHGLKTGRTNAAGSCMLAAFWEEDHYVLVGVFGSHGMYDRYGEAVKLYDYFVKGETE